jgi:GTPase Era involved in 16S rRNA processing
MKKRTGKATLSKGRSSWCLIFRHPVCLGPDGKQKLRVRRGLGTSDDSVAQQIINELNEILADETLWSPAGREQASAKYDARAVAAFFDPMQSELHDGWMIRDEMLPLPGGKDANDGYARVQLIGTTGAGKTTVLRQLIGTDPENERFPSISAAKTTICDIEVILEDNSFRGIVTFIPRDRVRQYIAECVLSAITSSVEDATEREIIRRFLEHSEQRFRLSYILGNPLLLRTTDEPDLLDADDEMACESEESLISNEERNSLLVALEYYLDQIVELAKASRTHLTQAAAELDIDLGKASKQERDILQELIEDQIADDECFHVLVDKIMDDVEQRFKYLDDGELVRGRDDWPIKWSFSTPNRSHFIRTINRFSSNYAPNYGRLLTPLVDGIRVAGPFAPEWSNDERPRLVLMDGQGIGHIADSSTSLSTSVTRRFKLSDAIMLVDNAAQPMQAAPFSVLQSLVTSGHESKLILAFTHFDEVKGDNLVNNAARKDHIVGSFDNAARAIGKSIGREAELSLRRLNPNRLVFLSNIQKRVSKRAEFTLAELNRLISAIMSTITPTGPIEYKPVYDVANLVLAVQKATQEFHDRWKAILGMGSRSSVSPEHWTRVKALTRRLGIFQVDEYDSLRPVADLIRLLQVQISLFLTTPLTWTPVAPAEDSEERQTAIDTIKTEVFERLHNLAKSRILEERVKDWVKAYEHRGMGSTRVRARNVATLYEEAAPIPNEMPGPDANKFLFEIRGLIADSIKAAGGQIRGWSETE